MNQSQRIQKWKAEEKFQIKRERLGKLISVLGKGKTNLISAGVVKW
jgi:hypothetical protein